MRVKISLQRNTYGVKEKVPQCGSLKEGNLQTTASFITQLWFFLYKKDNTDRMIVS